MTCMGTRIPPLHSVDVLSLKLRHVRKLLIALASGATRLGIPAHDILIGSILQQGTNADLVLMEPCG